MLNGSPALYTIKGVVQALKNDKNSFYFILKAVFVFKISILVLPFWSFRRKRGQKDKVNFGIYDVRAWLTNNYNIYIAQYLTL